MNKPTKSILNKPYPEIILGNIEKEKSGTITKVKFSDLASVAENTAFSLEDVEASYDLFPDLLKYKNTLVTLITRPDGQKGDRLNHYINMEFLGQSTKGSLITFAKNYVNLNYHMDKKVKDYIAESLVDNGAYVEIIMSNIGLNELAKDAVKMGHDSRITGVNKSSTFVNFNATLRELGLKKVQNDELLKVGLDAKKLENKLKRRSLFGKHKETELTIKSPKQLGAYALEEWDTGFTLKVDMRAVIPVCDKNDPKNMIGAYLVVDNEGNITYDQDIKRSEIDENITKLSDLLLKGQIDEEKRKDKKFIEDLYKVFEDKLGDEIDKDLNNKKLSQFAKVADNEWAYKILFKLALRSQSINLVYVSRENIQYYAADYHKNGVGKGIMEKIRTITSLRTFLRLSGVNGDVVNSIPRTAYELKLDDKEPLPKERVKEATEFIIKTNPNVIPFNLVRTPDIASFLTRLSTSLNVKHPGLPDMELNREDFSRDIKTPDGDREEKLGKHTIMAFNLPESLVDDMKDVSFAYIVRSQSAHLTSVVEDYQDIYNPQFSEHFRKLVRNDAKLYRGFRSIIEKDLKGIKKRLPKETKVEIAEMKYTDEYLIEMLIEEVIDNYNLALPEPSYSDPNATKEAFDAYRTEVEDAIELYFGSDAMPGLFGGVIDDIGDDVKSVVQQTMLRKWINEKGYLGDIIDMFSFDIAGQPKYDVVGDYGEYVEGVVKLMKGLKNIKKSKKKLDKLIEKFQSDEEEPEETYEDNTAEETTSDDNQEETPPTEEETPPEEGTPEEPPADTGTKEEDDLLSL